MGRFVALMVLVVFIVSCVGYLTNLVWTFSQHGDSLVLGILGIVIPFVGTIHGFMVW